MSARPHAISLAALADENFRFGLAVMLATALRRLSGGGSLQITVLDLNLSPRSRGAIAATVSNFPGRHEIRFLRLEKTASHARLKPLLDSLKIKGVFANYFAKLVLIEELRDAPNCLFLDSDIFVNCDLSEFPFDALERHPLAAVRDEATSKVLAGGGLVKDFLAAGLDATTPYFNAGVMAFDLDYWRRESHFRRALEMMPSMQSWYRAHAEDSFGVLEQSVLNAIYHRNFAELDGGWNRQCPVGFGILNEPGDSPNKLLHYLTRPKPWELPVSGITLPFYTALDQTGFAGWRPNSRLVRIKGRLSHWKYRLSTGLKTARTKLRMHP